MRQYEPLQLNNIAQQFPELARELQKVDRYLRQQSHTATTNAIASGQEPSAVVSGININMEVKEGGTSVSSVVNTLDFGAGFDLTESPTGEINVVLDYAEDKPDHGSELAGLTDDDHTQYILVAGTRAFTGDQSLGDFDLTEVDAIHGDSGGADHLELRSYDADDGSSIGIRNVWAIDKNFADITDDSKTNEWGYTDAGTSFVQNMALYARYDHSGSAADTVALLVGDATGYARIGIIDTDSPNTFSGFEKVGSAVGFYASGLKAFGTIAHGLNIGSSSASILQSSSNRELKVELKMADSASAIFMSIKPDSADASPGANSKVLQVQHSSAAKGDTPRFNVWRGATGIGVPADNSISFDDATAKGDTYIVYNGTGFTLDTFVNSVQVWDATTTKNRSVVALQVDGNVGFYGTTPVAQPAHIVDADGTLADVTTKFNTLLAQMATLGLQAAS